MSMTDLAIVRRSLRARLFSTVTTALTVAIAVAMLLLLLSMKDAALRSFRKGSGTMHLLVSADSSPLVSVLNGVFHAGAPARPIEWSRYQRIAGDGRVEFAIPTQQGDSYRGLPVMATGVEFFTRFAPASDEPWRFAQGRAFERPFEVVLGARASRATGLGMGDHLHLTHGRSEEGHEHEEFEFEVVGVLEPTGSAHDRAVFTDIVGAWIVHAFDRLEASGALDAHAGDVAHGEEGGHGEEADREESGHGAHDAPPLGPEDLTDEDRKITGIYLRCVTRGGSVSAVMPMLAAELRADPSITVADPAGEIGRLFTIIGNINLVLAAMAGVVLVSGAVSIMLALYNSMEQRRRQIAILRVLGASRGRVFGLVLTESAILGVLGAGGGVVLALIAGRGASLALRRVLGVLVEPVYPPEWLLGVSVAAVLLAGAAGVVPAMMAYRTSVSRNLRPVA